jgi:hypothetical protein
MLKQNFTARCLLMGAVFFAWSVVATAGDQREMYSIRSIKNRVVIPVWVYHQGPHGMPISDMQPAEFEVSEDGVKQEVVSVSPQRYYGNTVQHNLGAFAEYATTSRAIWRNNYDAVSKLTGRGVIFPKLGFYLVEYVPKTSGTSNCHNVKVKVRRKDSWVRAKGNYCVGDEPSDPLRDTTFGKILKERAAPAENGTISFSVQTGIFHAEGGLARVDVALDFSGYRFKHDWCGYTPKYRIGVLGLVYRTDGTLAKRFSDVRNGI